MNHPESRLDEELNPYAPPCTEEPYAEQVAPAKSANCNYLSRVVVLRMLAMLHFVFASLSIAGIGLMTGRASRVDELLSFVIGTFWLVFGGLSLGVGVGLCKLRRWAGRLIMYQALIVLALGFCIATYNIFRGAEASAFALMLPGVVLLLLAGFVRSRRSLLVCPDAYQNEPVRARSRKREIDLVLARLLK